MFPSFDTLYAAGNGECNGYDRIRFGTVIKMERIADIIWNLWYTREQQQGLHPLWFCGTASDTQDHLRLSLETLQLEVRDELQQIGEMHFSDIRRIEHVRFFGGRNHGLCGG